MSEADEKRIIEAAKKQSQEYLKWWQSSVMAGDQSTDQELLTRYHESQKI